MIKTPITKILFLDIETVGACSDFNACESTNPTTLKIFTDYFDWFLKRFPEDAAIKEDQKNTIFKKRAALVPELAKIICVSVAFVLENGEIRKQTFYGDDEPTLLKDVQALLDRCGKLEFYLCGHNLKNFDIPMLAKRMIINGLKPPSILPSYDTKPWDMRVVDTKEIWQYGAYTSIGSLDLLCSCLDIPSSKNGGINGKDVHNAYWFENRLEEISAYCERDVLVLIEIIKKLNNLE